MKKRLLSTLLALCMALALLPVTALAADASGSCGTGVTWSYSDGTVTIQGNGPMEVTYNESPMISWPWFAYLDQIHTVKIGDGVTCIATAAFYDCKNLASVEIPGSVITIESDAFSGCSSLANLVIPNGVTTIQSGAFSGCDSLTSVVIPNSVTTIESNVFMACGSLTGVTIPDSVTSIGGAAFYASGLTSVTIPSSITTIESSTFENCTRLTSVTIPDSVTTIKGYAFMNCASLPSITIPASVTSIGRDAFFECGKLKDVYYTGSESQWKQISNEGTQYLDLPYVGATYHFYANSAGGTGSGGAVPAEPEQPAAPSGISVTVGGKAVEWTDAKPFIDANNRTMVPLRAVADAMGLDVNWDASAREASFTDGGKTIYFPIDSSSARISGGGAVQMDTAAVIANERTYAPIRYLAEYFGYEVGWDAATQTVSLK